MEAPQITTLGGRKAIAVIMFVPARELPAFFFLFPSVLNGFLSYQKKKKKKKSASLSSTQWPLPFGHSALYIWPTCCTELRSLRLTVLRPSDLGLLAWPASWVILYGLHPFKVIFFFIKWKPACVLEVHPRTLWSISGLMWCFLSIKGTLEGPCIPGRFWVFSL